MGCLVSHPHSAHRISQVYTARFKGLHRPCTLTLWRGRRWAVAGSHPITPFAARHRSTYREKPLCSRILVQSLFLGVKPAAGGRKPFMARASRRRISNSARFRVAVATAAAARRRRSSRAWHARLRCPYGPSGSRWRARHGKKSSSSRVWPSIVVSEENLKISGSRIAQSARRRRSSRNLAAAIGSPACCARISYLELCRPMRSKRRSGRIFFLQSCRHSPQCSVNSISCTDR